MRIIARRRLREFSDAVANAKAALDAWYQEARKADWKTPNDIKEQYRHASIVGNNRVVFNIAGNKYRLVVRIDYSAGIIFIRFIGSHADYDKIDVEEI
ncbi:MAG: type II toxin-antitoxin system HigB family toxin [Pseudomonadota bacterium]